MSGSTKTDIRTMVRSRLEQVEPATASNWSEEISARLANEVAALNARSVMAYLATEHELNIDPLIANLLERDIEVAVPGVADQGRSMDAIRLQSLDSSELDVDRFGIRVPRNRRLIDPSDLDVVVVPGLAFDPLGHRLGRGAGFYDFFLKSVSERTTRVGACFSLQLLSAVPTDEHDQRVHLVVTERDLHRVS